MADAQAWGEGWQQGGQAVENRKQQKKSRQEQLQDDQRHTKLSVFTDMYHNGRISDPEMAHAVEDVYHDAEPEKKMSILGTIFNHKKAKAKHQEFLEGKQKSASDQQGIMSGAKQPGQPEAEADTAKKKSAIAALPSLFPEAT